MYGRVREVLKLWRVSHLIQRNQNSLVVSFQAYRERHMVKVCFEGMRDTLFQDIIN